MIWLAIVVGFALLFTWSLCWAAGRADDAAERLAAEILNKEGKDGKMVC